MKNKDIFIWSVIWIVALCNVYFYPDGSNGSGVQSRAVACVYVLPFIILGAIVAKFLKDE